MPSFFASGSDRLTCSGSVIDGRGIFTAATISRVTLAGATTTGVRIVQGTSTALPSLALRSSATLPMRGSIEGSAAAAGANCIASMASAYELLQSISLLMAYSGGQGILTIAASRSYVGQPWASTAVRLNLAYYVNTPDDAARRILHNLLQCGMDDWGYALAIVRVITAFNASYTNDMPRQPLLLVQLFN